MGLLLEHIEIIEGEKEMAAVISTMRKLGKDVDEVKQYLEKSTGKSLDDISDAELAKIAAQGAIAGQRRYGPQNILEPEYAKDFEQTRLAMMVPGGEYLAALKAREKIPSGTYQAKTPSGDTVDIDVDISGGDLRAIQRATKSAGKTFPQALKDLEQGRIGVALDRVIRRTVEPSK